jgi:hypothetical protein
VRQRRRRSGEEKDVEGDEMNIKEWAVVVLFVAVMMLATADWQGWLW